MKKRFVTLTLAGLLTLAPIASFAVGENAEGGSDIKVETVEDSSSSDTPKDEDKENSKEDSEKDNTGEDKKDKGDKKENKEPKAARKNLKKDYNKAYITGYALEGEKFEFRPEAQVSRGELSAMIARRMGYEETDADFTDVTTKDLHWAAGYIGALAADGVLSGYADGSFRPDVSISRGELAKVLDSIYKNISGKEIDAKSTELTDIEGHWAKQNIMDMESLGILKGHNDKTFKPEDFLTREEAVTAINRFIRKIEDREARDPQLRYKIRNRFEDMNIKRWSYNEVLEASTDYQFKSDDGKERLTKLENPEEGYIINLNDGDFKNKEVILEVLNFKRSSNGVPELVDDSKLDELAKRVANSDVKTLNKDSVKGEALKGIMNSIGIDDKNTPQRGSLLFKTDNKSGNLFASDIIDETLYAPQYFRSFSRIGFATSKRSSYTSLVIYMGFDEKSDIIDHILYRDEAVKIFNEVVNGN